MIYFYNKKYKDMTFKFNNKVLLSSRHIRIRRLSKKLTNKFFNSFRITVYIDKNAYTLNLPLKYGRIHFIFPVAFFKLYYRRDGVKSPALIDIKGEEK
jgi:hypothetical protein